MKKKSKIKQGDLRVLSYFFFFLISLILLPPSLSFADDSVCARVKIEIRQEMTLERQAFDAHMRINNGLTNITLEDVDVDVSFADEAGNTVRASSDPDDPDADFFIRIDSMENINDVNGLGTVEPSTSADIHWLIIPAPGASNGLESGTLYYVGARLTYTIGGEENVTEVSPDYIFVKPMPAFTLDYFLPTDVYGDDAFTQEIEPPVPFSLGVRVKNNGSGWARELKIESAQPEIVENEQGLLINFVIEGSEVNGEAVTPSLLADFGDIAPSTSGMARWIMTCSLSGEFVEFGAEFSHSDELGGELTSLMEVVNTHFLVRDVLVDLSGRDNIRDFLAKDGGVYQVYESDSADTSVLDQSASSSLQFTGQSGAEVYYDLSAPVTAGFMVVRLPDPEGGQKVIKEVTRSDGKQIKMENTWLSKTRNNDHTWNYFLNLFDANTTDSYTVVFGDAEEGPNAPVMQSIADRSTVEGEPLSFIMEASDPDVTIPSLSATPLPAGAVFTDQGNGEGFFDWTPAVGQAGEYKVTFVASDGVLEASQQITLSVCSVTDTDCDGMLDAWELAHFGTLDRDGTGDFDGDGISDLDEHANDTDPTTSNAPSIPEIFSPADGAEVTVLQPDLVVFNSTDPDGDPITYEFEIYADQALTDLTAGQWGIFEGIDTTSWSVPQELADNARHYWRVRASDGIGFSQWAYGSFFVNTFNDPPGDFNISSPVDQSEVDTLTPALEITNSLDPDGDAVTYAFEVYADTIPVASASGLGEGVNGSTSWVVDIPLDDNTWYSWKSVATDEHGETAETPLSSFFVNTMNDAPSDPVIFLPAVDDEVAALELDLIVSNASDLDEDALVYIFELDRVNSFDSGAWVTSGDVLEGMDTTSWSISGLEDNALYHWRVKASDGAAESAWTQGNFFVNTVNDAPSIPTLKNPGEGASVETLTPSLEVNASEDRDGDSLTYRYEVYSDDSLSSLVFQGESGSPKWVVPSGLSDNTMYYWRAQAEDEHGALSGWMDAASFFVNNNGVDDPPRITLLEPQENILTGAASLSVTWEDADPDSNAGIGLYYDTDNTGQDGVLIEGGLEEDPDGPADSYLWDTTGMGDGTYYLYAVISDGTSSDASYGPGSVTIDRTPPLVEASPPGGVYYAALTVALGADESAEIYYTLDGSEPTTGSILYSADIDVIDNITIRFMAVDAAGNVSGIVDENYSIEDPDSDGDGMEDEWERNYFGDLARDGTGDYDGDGLSDLDEYSMGTDPANNDSDNDGYSDGDEVDAGSDPTSGGSVPNYPPVANAGPDQNVRTGNMVTPDGSGSNDPEGMVITFLWSFTEVPVGSGVTDGSLSGVASAQPTFTTDVDGVYRLQLLVNDGASDSAPDEVIITAATPNVPPNADAGSDQNVLTGASVALDGSGSMDPDNGPMPLSYLWSFDSVPAGSLLADADISGGDMVNAGFVPDVDGTYVLRLSVSDGDLTSEGTARIAAATSNVPPNANAGADITIALGGTVSPDGLASNDPDNGPGPSLTYAWSFVSLATGSGLTNADIVGADTATPSFVPDVAGTYVLELMVGDGQDYAYDNMAVTAEEPVLSGDLDSDGDIDGVDRNILRAALRTCDGDAGYNADADYDDDGCITFGDYRIWYGYYQNQ